MRHRLGTLFEVVHVGLTTNALLVVACLPLVVALIGTDPARSWPLLALLTPLCGPAWCAAFTVLSAYTVEGETAVVRTFLRGWRASARRAVPAVALATATLVVLGVDARAAWGRPVGALVLPPLAVAMTLVVATTLLVLVAIADRPGVRLRDAARAGLFLAVRRWYLTGFSLAVLLLFEALLISRPAVALGLAASPLLYVVGANSRFTLQPAWRGAS